MFKIKPSSFVNHRNLFHSFSSNISKKPNSNNNIVVPRSKSILSLRGLAKIFTAVAASYLIYEYNPYRTKIFLSYDHNEFNNSLVPSLDYLYEKHFYPSLVCPTAFLQSVINTVSHPKPVRYNREPLLLPDGGQVTLDWALPTKKIEYKNTRYDNKYFPYEPSKETKILLVLHGLTGGSECNYIHALVDTARSQGYRVAVLNQRGVNQNLTTPLTFHGGLLDDVEFAINHIKKDYPSAPVVAVGTSIGANMLIRYLGEAGSNSRKVLKAAVAMGAPFDLDDTLDSIEGTVYEDFFAKTYIEKNFLPNYELFQNLKETHGISVENILQVKNIRDFHKEFTIKLHNHKDVAEYFSTFKISDSHIKNVDIPLLILHAKDDPISTYKSIPVETLKSNPNIIFAETKRGGHVCWFTGFWPKRWYDKPTVEFTENILKLKEFGGSKETNLSALSI